MDLIEGVEDERWCHAACLSIAEGRPGWQDCPDKSPAIEAVKHLRVSYESLKAQRDKTAMIGPQDWHKLWVLIMVVLKAMAEQAKNVKAHEIEEVLLAGIDQLKYMRVEDLCVE